MITGGDREKGSAATVVAPSFITESSQNPNPPCVFNLAAPGRMSRKSPPEEGETEEGVASATEMKQ